MFQRYWDAVETKKSFDANFSEILKKLETISVIET